MKLSHSLLLVAVLCAQALSGSLPDPGRVRILTWAMVSRNRPFAIRDLDVFLKEVGTDKEAASAQTDVGGMALLFAPPGSYLACWKGIGFIPDCDANIIEVQGGKFYYPPPYTPKPKGTQVYGALRFKDGSRPGRNSDTWWGNPELRPTIDVLDKDGVILSSVRASYDGYYFPDVSVGQKVYIRAGFEAARVLAEVSQEGRMDLVLPNSPPKIKGMFISYKG